MSWKTSRNSFRKFWSFFCYFVIIAWKRIFETDFCSICTFLLHVDNDIFFGCLVYYRFLVTHCILGLEDCIVLSYSHGNLPFATNERLGFHAKNEIVANFYLCDFVCFLAVRKGTRQLLLGLSRAHD